jgi:Secretion system C-terminal sorting domain/HYR domain
MKIPANTICNPIQILNIKTSVFLSVLLLITALFDLQAQNWTQIGSDIDGETEDNWSGYAVSLSANGNIVAIGEPLTDETGIDDGQVRVYQNIAGNWTQIGSDIVGEAAGDRFGSAVSLSAGGDIVAVSARRNDGNGTDAGHVRVYQNVSGNWIQIGSDIDGEAAGDQSGDAVSLSANGSILAIGSVRNEAWAGDVRVYQNISGNWTQIGSDIVGEAVSDQSGCSVSLSSNGNIVAIGAFGNSNAAGQVRVYQNVSGNWTQTGQDINGYFQENLLGYSVSLNANGNIIAIGAPGFNTAGYVQVFQNISGTWTQIGEDIYGENDFDESGCSVSLNANGNIMAIGSRGVEGGVNIDGSVRVYKNISGNWLQTGNTITGEPLNEFPGIAVSLNAGGNILAIGAPYNNGNGEEAGHVRVYQQCDSSVPPIPNLATLPNVTAECSVTTLTPPTATDGCGNTVQGTSTVTLPIISQGTTTVIWIYNSGNTSSVQTQNVVIEDVTNPSINCVGNQTVDADQSPFYTVNGTEFDPTLTSDNCGIASVVNLYNVAFSLAGAQIPEGNTSISWLITDSAGNTQTCSFVVTVVNTLVGIETLQQNGISIYPNPVNDILQIDFAKNNIQKLVISDIGGRNLFEKTTIHQNETIELSDYRKGVYMISIQTDKEVFTTKIVKE